MSWLLSGDCIGIIKQYDTTPLLPYSLRVHLIESDRIATPGGYGAGGSITFTTGKNTETGNTIYDGVEVDLCLLCGEAQHFAIDPAFQAQADAYHVCAVGLDRGGGDGGGHV